MNMHECVFSAGISLDGSPERSRIMLDLLQSVERDGSDSQRRRASEFGVALGLVNAYLHYCVKKGYVKVRKIPARRYAYFLTPKGFSEKSRLTLELVSKSLTSFRQARADYATAIRDFRTRGCTRIALAGLSELAEICLICAAEQRVILAAVVEPEGSGSFAGLPVVSDFASVPGGFDGVMVTDLRAPQAVYDDAVRQFGSEKVCAIPILGVKRVVIE